MNIDISSIIMPELESYKSFIENFAKSRFIINASEYDTNEKEREELENISDHIRCEIYKDGNSVSLVIYYDYDSEYMNIIQNGMDAPLTGGKGGIATNPDGTTYYSNVPEQLQGYPIEEYEKPAEDVKEETKIMSGDLFYQRLEELINDSDTKEKIAIQVKPYIEKELQTVLR